jgi:hypothetical protein
MGVAAKPIGLAFLAAERFLNLHPATIELFDFLGIITSIH